MLSSSWDGRPFGHNRHGPKITECAPFGRGELGPHVTQCSLGETDPPTKWHLDPSGRLATTNMGQKIGELCPFGEGELGHHLTKCPLGRGLPSYQVASWSIEPFGHNRYGPKIGRLCPFGGGGPRSPSGTMWPGPGPTSIPSGILIHAAVWPQ